MVWLCLVTHPLLDAFTVYGTQILLPFSDYPVGWSTLFIIDPLYTLPLVVGVVAAWYGIASVVRQADCTLCRAARPRLTFSRMSEAVAVQMKGVGCSLCWAM